MDKQFMLQADDKLRPTQGMRVGVWSASRYLDDLHAKAAALDKILASWGMTWEEYQTGTDAPAHGREPNEHSEEVGVNTGEGSQTR